MSADVKILDGNTFVVSDSSGDIEASMTDPTGLFSFDTRFLSKWILTINDQRLNPLSVDDLQYFETRFFLVPGTGTVYVDAKLSVIRQRAVGGGFHEELTILNHDDKAVDLAVRIEADNDFADLFEVKDALKKKGEYYRKVDDDRLTLGYKRDTYVRETWISATESCRIDEHGLSFDAHVEPHEGWTTDLHVTIGGGVMGFQQLKYERDSKKAKPNMERSLDRWLDEAPSLLCDWDPLKATYQRSLVDLAALRFSPPVLEGHSLPAAGLPWFMTMFGRDSIITSLQALPFTAGAGCEHAESPRHLAGHARRRLPRRGAGQHPARDALRRDDGLRGTAALALLRLRRLHDAVRRPARRVRALDGRQDAGARGSNPKARAALNWIDEYADLRGRRLRRIQAPQHEDRPREPVLEGLLGLDLLPRRHACRASRAPPASCRATPTTPRCAALVWRARSGTTPTSPSGWRSGGGRSQAALQPRLLGRGRRVLRPGAGRRRRAGRLAHLQHRPPALERHRRQVEGEGRGEPSHGPSACSRAGACARWPRARGATTRSATTWAPSGPSTTRSSPGACGATASRRRRRASPPASSTPAQFFDGRLPEAFAGYPREHTNYPVEYPTACSPQAWSTGTALLLLRTMLGLEPIEDHLIVDPALPQGIGHCRLLDIPGRWGHVDAFARGTIDVGRIGRPRRQLGVIAQTGAKAGARTRSRRR